MSPYWIHSDPELPSDRNPTWKACVLRHAEPRRALTGALVCGKHNRDLVEDLDDLALLYPLLEEVLEPGSVTADELVRYSRRIDPPAPVRLEVVALRDARTTWDAGSDPDAVDVIGVLGSWATVVREERGLVTPTARATLTSELATLRAHHEWAIDQPWIDEYAKDVHRAVRAVRHACGEYDAEPVGRCPRPTEDGSCDGRLYPDRAGAMRVRCAQCGETWDEGDLARLGLVLDSSG